MNNLRTSLFMVLAAIVHATPAGAKAATVANYFPNCAALAEGAGRTLTVNPAASNAGTYQNIGAALQAAKPGDTIALMTGDYGSLALIGMNKDSFITIAAAEGQSPKFEKVTIGGYRPASHWRLTGLTISSFFDTADKRAQTSLVMISNSDNIILENNNVSAQEGTIEWKAVVPGVTPPKGVPNGISARQSSCISVTGNHLRNLFGGIDFGGDQVGDHGKYFLVSGNTIDNFAGDGIDHYGGHVRIENNRITNGHDICNNQCVHNDGIQGWNYNNKPVINSDVVIDGNTIIAQTTPDLVLPVDTLQGITIFDGKWDGVRIFNNVVIVNAFHGISVYGVNNASIINNTVAPTDPTRPTWIMANIGKGDPPGAPYNVVIRNNAVVTLQRKSASTPTGLVSDHNVFLRDADDFVDAFVKFDPKHFAYDLHPARKSPVIGEGSKEDAPTTDIDGRPRQGAIDVGAYSGSG
jgi:hypothetical protein